LTLREINIIYKLTNFATCLDASFLSQTFITNSIIN
jgi:hypothetical protein